MTHLTERGAETFQRAPRVTRASPAHGAGEAAACRQAVVDAALGPGPRRQDRNLGQAIATMVDSIDAVEMEPGYPDRSPG